VYIFTLSKWKNVYTYNVYDIHDIYIYNDRVYIFTLSKWNNVYIDDRWLCHLYIQWHSVYIHIE